MQKSDAVAMLRDTSPGVASLLKPTMLKAALAANDRIKLALTLLQAAAHRARHPHEPVADFGREIVAAGIVSRADADRLQDVPATASIDGDAVCIPELPWILAALRDDLAKMARPVADGADAQLPARVREWLDWLGKIRGPLLDAQQLDALMHGQRQRGDSVHLTVMDLHKALNRLAAELSTESIDGAHAWQLAPDGSDRPRVEAFMRGLARTRHLKGEHPGLDTAVTRDGTRLLIQNDIGENDAHVLVIQVDTRSPVAVTTLTYSDLHRQRVAFFQRLLEEVGAAWTDVDDRRAADLNAGQAYYLTTATLTADSEARLQGQLEGIAERIVFLIDWNRARKRLLAFVGKTAAVAVLTAAARQRSGHMAWLNAGAERLVWNAMASQVDGAFRLGDRLDEVLGDEAARDFLVEVMALAARAAGLRQPTALVEDEVRVLLARRLHGRRGEFELLQEHASLCHAIAQGLSDALAAGADLDPAAANRLAARAKVWERQADMLVVQARTLADRQPQWRALERLVERSDDVADALEEACFVHSLAAEHLAAIGSAAFGQPAREALRALADTVLAATQDHVRALVVAGMLGEASDARDHDDFLAASWRVLQAERQCDELLRSARRALAADCRERGDPVGLMLGNELTGSIEHASDALLALGYGLRERAFHRIQAPAS